MEYLDLEPIYTNFRFFFFSHNHSPLLLPNYSSVLHPPHLSQDQISIVDVDDIFVLASEMNYSTDTQRISLCSGIFFIEQWSNLCKWKTITSGLSSIYVVVGNYFIDSLIHYLVLKKVIHILHIERYGDILKSTENIKASLS